MNRLLNLSTKAKLLLNSGVILALLVVGGAMSIGGLTRVSGQIESIFTYNVLPLKQLGELQGQSHRMSTLVAWHLLAHDGATMKKWSTAIDALDEEIKTFLTRYEPIIVSQSEREKFERFKTTWSDYRTVRAKVLSLSGNFSKDAASELQNTELAEKLSAMLDTVNGLVKENEVQAQQSHDESQTLANSMTWLMLIGMVMVVIWGLFSSWKVTQFLVKGLENLLEATKQLRGGNMAFRSTVTTTEEIGQLSQAFNQMADELVQSLEEMNARIDIMNTTSIVSEGNLKGDILTANDKYVELSQYTREELIGAPHSITRHPDVPKEVFKNLWNTIGQGKLFRGTIKNRAKNGTPYYVDAVIKPVMGPNGKPQKYLSVRYDITQFEIARQNMKGILDAINKSYGTVEFDLKGNILTANTMFVKMLGYGVDELTGKPHSLLVEPAYSQSPAYRTLWEKLAQGQSEAGQYKYLGKGGKELWLQASYNPVMDEVGRTFKVIGLATDITQQRQALVEVEKLISAAAVGQLSQRIQTDLFTGDLRHLTESVNRLVDAVTQPLHEAQGVLNALAANDLTACMTGTYQGEFEDMKRALNLALKNLTETIATVHDVAQSVLSGAEDISKGNEDLSHRTGEQAAALEETSASMEQMTATVKQNADNAKQADQLAIAARQTADEGTTVIHKAVAAMGEINQSSNKIADIINVIDEIAFQTNLLALNAAVEAARAGEHGRGFAVVASEVRNLAQRSALAAKEITALIQESIQRVGDGSALVHQSGKTLENIVDSVKRVTDIIAEISAASQEQAIGIDQVNRAIMSMDEATQQNVGLVESTTSAAQSMKEQAKGLFQQVAVFKIAHQVGQRAAQVSGTKAMARSAASPSLKPTADHNRVKRTPKGSVLTQPVGRKQLVGAAVLPDKGRGPTEGEFEEF